MIATLKNLHLNDSGTRRYLFRCLKWRLRASLGQCPVCHSRKGSTIDRKFGITSLVDCSDCGLLYRRPQEPAEFAEEFYQDEYESSLATVMPGEEELDRMLETDFASTEKNFTDKISLLADLRVPPGARVLDFGASWGYGVWQLKKAGYQAEGLELSRARASYGKDKLGVVIHDSEERLDDGAYDAVFSNHVLEHIPRVTAAFAAIRRVLKPGGVLLSFVPNGSAPCRENRWKRFHTNWGRLHPIYLNDEFLARHLKTQPWCLASKRYEDHCDHSLFAAWDRESQLRGELSENELMLASIFQ